MLSRKLLMTTMGVALSMGFAMGQANAFIGNQFFGGQLNLLSDNSAESQGVDTNGNSELDVGDTLRGIFDIGTIEDQTGGGGTNNLAANGVELSALFEIEVATRVFSNGIDATAGYDFTFVPHAAFEGVYGAGAMIALFEDVGSEFNRNINTGAIAADIAAMELLVTNGSLVMTWGIPAAASPDFDADNFWGAFGAPADPSAALGVPLGTEIGEFNLGLSILPGSLFYSHVLQIAGGCAVLPGGCGGDGLVDVNGSGGIKGTLGPFGRVSSYDVFNNVDFTLVPIPEPTTFGLMGLGLAGLGFVARRRRTKQA